MLTTQGTIHIQSSDQRVWDEMYEKYNCGDVDVETLLQKLYICFCQSPVTVGRLESFHAADLDSGGVVVLVQEASSKGFELGKAQLILPSQNNSFRMHCRLEEEQRLNQLLDKTNIFVINLIAYM